MKNIKYISFVLLSSISFSTCSTLLKDSGVIAKEQYSLIIDYSLENNKDGLVNVFAKNISSSIEDFDLQIDELIECITGTYVSLEYSDGTLTTTARENFKQTQFISNAASELYTTESKYFLSILYCSIDEFDSDNVGVWNFRIQKCSSDYDDFIPFSGADEWEYGETYRGITFV